MTGFIKKVHTSQQVIRQAAKRFPAGSMAIAWTGGKDSTVLLHLVKTAWNGTVPFPVVFNDSTMEFDEVYQFIAHLTRLWKLNLHVIPHDPGELARFRQAVNEDQKLEASRYMKIHAMERFQRDHGTTAFLVGIRRDEHPARSKEKYFSKRETHVRVHPILHFTENDIWHYIRTFRVPYVSLYDHGYRSLGEKPFTDRAVPGGGERSGREPGKEQLMEKLRNMGYW